MERRALAILEKSFGPEHPEAMATRRNYAALLEKIEQEKELKKMESRAGTLGDKSTGKAPK